MRSLRAMVRRLLGPWLMPREDAALRQRLDRTPLTELYPLDPEAKLLRAIGIPAPFFDVGANTGIYSALFADRLAADDVYLFEPLPELQKALKRRLSQAHLLPLALSDQAGPETLHLPLIRGRRYLTRASLNRHAEPGQDGRETITVERDTLDAVIIRLGLDRLGLLKIDVEGHEFAVLRGGEDTLKKFRPTLLIEIEQRHHDFPVANIFDWLEQRGYGGYFLDATAYTLQPVGAFDAAQHQDRNLLETRQFSEYLNNFLFIPEEQETQFLASCTAFLAREAQQARA